MTLRLLLITCFLTGSSLADWRTNITIPEVTNLGALIASVTQDTQGFLTHSNSNKHLLVWYYDGALGNLLDVNLNTSECNIANYRSARLGVRGSAYSNGLLYFALPNCVSSNGNWYGELWSYSPTSRATNRIALITQYGGYHIEVGDDGWLYLGSQISATLERYNPVTGVLESYGKMDTNNVDGNSTIYSIAADSRYVYGQIYNGWYLSVIDNDTGARTNVWYGEGDSAGGVCIFRGKEGGWYYERLPANTGNAHVWYALSNGVPNLIGTNANFSTNVNYYGGIVWGRAGLVDNAANATNDTGYTFDFDSAYPNSSNNVAMIGYSITNSGTWTYLSASNFSLGAASLRRIVADTPNLFIVGPQYGPWMRYTPSTSNVTIYGTAMYSIYDAVKNGGKWYVAGYDSATLVFDPQSPWTLTPSTPDRTALSVNPRKLGLEMRTHEYYIVSGADMLYAASHVDRNGAGGYLGWYDPVFDTNGTYRPTTFEYATNDVSDLTTIYGGSNVVYLALGWPALYVFDSKTKTMLLTNSTIAPGLTTLGKCVEMSNGILVGLSGTNSWRYNVGTGETTTNTVPGAPVTGYRLTKGPDDCVWATLGSDLYRIDSELSAELIKSGVGSHYITFVNGDAYLYNGTELHALMGLLVETRYTHTHGTGTFGTSTR